MLHPEGWRVRPDAGAKALLRSLALEVGGDIDAAEVVRILRVPGTLNHKYDPPRKVEQEPAVQAQHGRHRTFYACAAVTRG